MSLEKYGEKRNFGITPEPSPTKTARPRRVKALLYVIHKHQASHLHYDLRLEWRGVLLSWAIPKGPSLDPGTKRLAMPVEDHPLEYADFEGVIPDGEYGAGTVMVWDRGTWEPEVDDVQEALRRGDLKFELHGKKLRGSWVLVRTQGRWARGGRSSWLLIKHRDQFASPKDVTTEQPRSAVSGRLLAEIAEKNGGNVAKAAKGDPVAAISPAAAGRRAPARKRARTAAKAAGY